MVRLFTFCLIFLLISPIAHSAYFSPLPTAADALDGSYTIKWKKRGSDLGRYKLYETPPGGSQKLVYLGSGLSKSFAAKANGSYLYKLYSLKINRRHPSRRQYDVEVNRKQSSRPNWRRTSTLTLVVDTASPPPIPASITVPITDNNGAYTISWASASTATKYQLQERKNSGSWITLTSTSSSRSYSRTGRGNGSYRYRVRAYNTFGWSGYRTSSLLTVLLPPIAPSYITVPTTDTNGAYTVNWGSVSTTTKYQLQESKNNGAWTTLASTITSTSYGRTGRGNGSYRYRIRAYNTSGWSGYRTSSSLTVLLPPSTPSSITVPTTDNNGSIAISWAASSTATKYQLQESVNSGSWTTLTSIITSTSYSRTGRGSGSYIYRVRAYNTSSWSGYRTSSTVTVTVNTTPTIAGIPNTTAILGESYSFTPEASDADNDSLTFTISSKPAWASFDTGTGQLSGTPTPLGIDTNIIIRVNDGRGGSASLDSFNINVRDSYVVPSQRRCQP